MLITGDGGFGVCVCFGLIHRALWNQLSAEHFTHQLCVLFLQVLTLPCTICEPLHNREAEINVLTVGFGIVAYVRGQ